MKEQKKVTVATVKAFIRHRLKDGNLAIRVKSDFDGMIDGVRPNEDQGFHPARPMRLGHVLKNNQGVAGVWFVGHSRDYVERLENGFEVTNCCGSWEVKTI